MTTQTQLDIGGAVGNCTRRIGLLAAALAAVAVFLAAVPASTASADHGYEFNSGAGQFSPNGVLCAAGKVYVYGPFAAQRPGSFGDTVTYQPWLERWNPSTARWVVDTYGNQSAGVAVSSTGTQLPNQFPAFNINRAGYYRVAYKIRWTQTSGGVFAGLGFMGSAYVVNTDPSFYFYDRAGRAVSTGSSWCQYT